MESKDARGRPPEVGAWWHAASGGVAAVPSEWEMTDPKEHRLDWLREARGSRYVFETREIASFTSLIAAAKHLEPRRRQPTKQIATQEVAMALWPLCHIPNGTHKYFAWVATAGAGAKK